MPRTEIVCRFFTRVDLDVASDAAGWGFGAHCGDMFIQGKWSDEERDRYDINIRELWTVAMAVDAFRDEFRGKRVRFLIDNQATIEWIRGWKAAPPAAGIVLRFLHRVMVDGDIELNVDYINTKANVRADALSRDEFATFASVAGALTSQVRVPPRARLLFDDPAWRPLRWRR